MKIYSPVSKPLIRQGFGKENTNASVMHIYQSLGLLGHDGWDFMVNCKDSQVKHGGQCQPIYYSMDGYGTISYIQKDDAHGWGINAIDEDGIHKYCWWHFDIINPDLKVGDRIEGGDYLGGAGNTGYSTGAHLHFGLYEYGLEDNGYKGAIDPTPFYVPIFVNDFIDGLKAQISIIKKILEVIKSLLK